MTDQTTKKTCSIFGATEDTNMNWDLDGIQCEEFVFDALTLRNIRDNKIKVKIGDYHLTLAKENYGGIVGGQRLWVNIEMIVLVIIVLGIFVLRAMNEKRKKK
jgi:hypothetical protein